MRRRHPEKEVEAVLHLAEAPRLARVAADVGPPVGHPFMWPRVLEVSLVNTEEPLDVRQGHQGGDQAMRTRQERVRKHEHEFTLVIEGPLLDDDVLDQLYEAGCDDASFGMVDDVGFGDFHRRTSTFAEAVAWAIRDIESVPGLRVVRIEPDDLLTMSEIAERLGRTRESVRLLISGHRGPGDFPAPASHLTSRSRLWRWSDVTAWTGELPVPEQERARVIAAVNAALELRRRRPDLAEDERSLVDALAG